jgi:hypothetical protein
VASATGGVGGRQGSRAGPGRVRPRLLDMIMPDLKRGWKPSSDFGSLPARPSSAWV